MITVVKLGGRVQSDPQLTRALAGRWRAHPQSLCIVHGGGDEISAFQRQLGREPLFVNGRRVTTDEDVELVRMVLSGSVNKRLVAALVADNVSAVGISGEDSGLIAAEPMDASFGRAGKPVSADVRLVRTLLDNGFLPVISPVGTDITSTTGAALNVNGDDASAVIAAQLGAELLLIVDVGGVLDAEKKLLPSLDPAHVERLIVDGTVNSGMHAKLEAGFAALDAGAIKVRIAGIEALHDDTCGTELSLTPSLT